MTDRHNRLFITTSLCIQVVLVIFFALRKWDFPLAMQVGWFVYALAVPAVIVSIRLIRGGKPWYLIAAGFLFALWAAFGTVVDIIHPVEWRSPILLAVFLPYVLSYTASQMFYWWPLLKVHRPSWFIYTALYCLSTWLNMSSH
jgi:hypothetical protein